MTIPKIIHRIVPEQQTTIMEYCWDSVVNVLGKDWELITHVAPENTQDGWELTRDYWSKCPAPAFMCDLMRLEVLWKHGGVYLDSDVLIFKDLSPLLGDRPFVGLEEGIWLCNAVIGSPPNHPAIMAMIEETKQVLDSGTFAHGPIVTTEVLAPRDDVTFLGYEEFYMYGPAFKNQIPLFMDDLKKSPNVYGIHLWAASWFDDGKPPSYLSVYNNKILEASMRSPFKTIRSQVETRESIR